MKFIDLNNIGKYFYMADAAYCDPVRYVGSLTEVSGVASNGLSDEICNFYIKLNQDDTITFKLNDEVKLLQ